MALNLRITEEQDRRLAELARSQGVSKNEAAVRAIEETWARRGHEAAVRGLARAAVERYGPLLDRLAK
ncbi:toxin-antitoxin system HicB family antitoxin [Georgenia sunbinii]|uniref:toxin-antitoxin system HicB family antitoxin n=1 Tax=Georgenia sunbinii TaxID=3117728 RepID=UPI002F264CC1